MEELFIILCSDGWLRRWKGGWWCRVQGSAKAKEENLLFEFEQIIEICRGGLWAGFWQEKVTTDQIIVFYYYYSILKYKPLNDMYLW